jgi:chromosomal replication initiation ATPase DnaA
MLAYKLERKPPQRETTPPVIVKAPPRSASRLLAEVCARHNVRSFDVMRKCNEARVVRARNEMAYLLRQSDPQKWSYPAIGRYLGKHHTTMIYAVNQHSEALQKAAA